MKRILELLKKKTPFYEALKNLREGRRADSRNYGEANVFGMYRACCTGTGTGGRPDLSGLDLSHMDLREAMIRDAVFSRPVPGITGESGRGLYADLTDTDLDIFDMRTKPECPRIGRAVCHPEELVLLLVQESEDGETWLLKEWNLTDRTERIYEEVSPWSRIGYSDSGSYLWWEDFEEEEILWILERKTGRLEKRVWHGDGRDELHFTGRLPGEKIGIISVQKEGELLLEAIKLQEVFQGEAASWQAYEKFYFPTEWDISEWQLALADEEHILVGNRREIWCLHQDTPTCIFSLKESNQGESGIVWAVNGVEKAVYVFFQNQEQQFCLRLNPLTGEREREWNWDAHGAWEWKKHIEISLGGSVAAIYSQHDGDGPMGAEFSLRAVSTVDGTLYQEWKREGQTDRFFGHRHRNSFYREVFSLAGKELWLTVIDPVFHMAVFMKRNGIGEYSLGGYCFLDGEEKTVMAIYTDWEDRLLYTFDGAFVQAYSVDTGQERKERQQFFGTARKEKTSSNHKKMALLFRNQRELLEAEFAEKGKALYISVREKNSEEGQEEIWKWDLETGDLIRRSHFPKNLALNPEERSAAERVYQQLGKEGFTIGCPGRRF